jgi:hypothetical protein
VLAGVGRDDRGGGDGRVVAACDAAVRLRKCGAGWDRGAVLGVEGEAGCGGGDDDVLLVDDAVVSFAEADEVGQVGLAAVGPVENVVGVGAAAVAAGVLAAAAVAVAVAEGAPEGGRGLAGAAADVGDGTGQVVDHRGDGRVAADQRQGGRADGGAVEVAAVLVRRVPERQPGRGGFCCLRLRAGCFRGNAGGVRGGGLGGADGRLRAGCGPHAGVDDDLVGVGVVGGGGPGAEVVGADLDEGVGEVLRRFHLGWRRLRPGEAGPGLGVPAAESAESRFRGNVAVPSAGVIMVAVVVVVVVVGVLQVVAGGA